MTSPLDDTSDHLWWITVEFVRVLDEGGNRTNTHVFMILMLLLFQLYGVFMLPQLTLCKCEKMHLISLFEPLVGIRIEAKGLAVLFSITLLFDLIFRISYHIRLCISDVLLRCSPLELDRDARLIHALVSLWYAYVFFILFRLFWFIGPASTKKLEKSKYPTTSRWISIIRLFDTYAFVIFYLSVKRLCHTIIWLLIIDPAKLIGSYMKLGLVLISSDWSRGIFILRFPFIFGTSTKHFILMKNLIENIILILKLRR